MSAAVPPNASRREVSAQRPAAAARPMKQANAAIWFEEDDTADFRLNLRDISLPRGTLHVEGLKPTLFSRLLDIVAPLKV